MNQQDYQEARSLLFKYKCSSFFMAREGEGDYDKYRAFQVPEYLKNKWIEEYIDENFVKMEAETNHNEIHTLFYRISDAMAEHGLTAEMLTSLAEFIEKRKSQLDSFTLLVMTEDLLRRVEEYNKSASADRALSSRVQERALDILREILNDPITVDEGYRHIKYMDTSVLAEENIRERIELEIAFREKQLG